MYMYRYVHTTSKVSLLALTLLLRYNFEYVVRYCTVRYTAEFTLQLDALNLNDPIIFCFPSV